MKIELNKKQYKELVHSIETAEIVYAVLRDMVDMGKYDKKLTEKENIGKYILRFAKEFGVENIIENFEGENVASEKYIDYILDDLYEYDDYIFWDGLATKLAEKEFFNTYSEEEIINMDVAERYLKCGELEDKYSKEFEEYGIDKLEIIERLDIKNN
ncbi:hypothetical protein KKA23_01585 [Patescibacteria group bacterium]|nr:hypothetical protein [Patescibacteria group bacterium]MBU3922608.1 hypothetical protein [Patescibacteria group bacterium]